MPALSTLSNQELLTRLKALVARERAATLEVLDHLNEVARRRLFLGLGYSSLFAYCTQALGYSSSAAGRRIDAARVIGSYPEAREYLEKNEINLVTLSLVASILKPSNRTELFSKIRGKSQREVEAIASTYRPSLEYRDRVKPVSVPVEEARVESAGAEFARAESANAESQKTQFTPTDGSKSAQALDTGSLAFSRLECGSPPATPIRLEKRLHIQFLASEAFMKKFEQARALLSNRPGGHSFERVFEVMIDEFIERHSPEKKNERREERRAKKAAAAETSAKVTKPAPSHDGGGWLDDNIPPAPTRATTETRRRIPVNAPDESSRHIPAAVRDLVFKRDKGRCAYVGANGRRCAETRYLQIDHIVPFSRGGATTPSNLRLLCRVHNRAEAERIYGVGTIRRYHRKK